MKTTAGLWIDHRDAVIATIREVESILIFGPGEAKVELKSRLELANLGGRVVALETEDKMTEHEIAVEIRKYFQ